MDESSGIIDEKPQNTADGVWRPWPTLLLGLGIGVATFIASVMVVGIFIAVRMVSNPKQDLLGVTKSLSNDGLLIVIASIVSELAAFGLVLLVIKLRRGKTISEYLALRPVSLRVLLSALFATGVFAAVYDGVSHLLARPTVSRFEIDMYRGCPYPFIFWLLIVVAAPITEEVFFRGFFLEGFRRSRMGNTGAVVVTALMWASLHLQYDLYDIGSILLFGLLLGAVRLKSRSLWPCLAMHSLLNLIATVEMLFHLRSM